VPVYELLGGPTRQRIRVYEHASSPDAIKRGLARGFTAFKTNPAKRRPARYVETPAQARYAADKFAERRQAAGAPSDHDFSSLHVELDRILVADEADGRQEMVG
jgi:galactonate dehydratase